MLKSALKWYLRTLPKSGKIERNALLKVLYLARLPTDFGTQGTKGKLAVGTFRWCTQTDHWVIGQRDIAF